MRKFLLGLAVVLGVLLALVAQWPADGIARLTADSDLALRGFEGTVWSGTADGGRYRGLELGRVRWKLDPLGLLRLALHAQIAIDGPEVAAHGTIVRFLGGEIEGRDLHGRLPAEWLQRILNEPFLGLAGQLRFEFSRAQIGADGRLVALEGTSRWQAARLTGRLAGELGDLEVHWRTESAGVILGSLADSGGPLELEGVVTVTVDNYQIDARLGARSDQVALRQALELLGRPDAAGKVRLRIGGPMLPLRWGHE